MVKQMTIIQKAEKTESNTLNFQEARQQEEITECIQNDARKRSDCSLGLQTFP
jgi:hypothetical protein